MFPIDKRLNKLREQFSMLNVDAFLITKGENIRYLSGFTGGSDARLLVSETENYIITDSRYTEQVSQECPDWELIEQRPKQNIEWDKLLKKYNKIGFENTISYKDYATFREMVGERLIPADNVIEKLRMIKDAEELDLLRKAAEIGTEVFAELRDYIKAGIMEKDVANQIEFLLKSKGCDKPSFDTIAVAGENAALPHGQPTNRVLNKGDMLTLDYGGFYKGYAGDMTRTVAIGHADSKFKDYYYKVLEAQKLGVSLVKAGVAAKDIDLAVRNKLESFGLGEYFAHGTGHGLGLEVHEIPSISLRSDIILQENMVITIEPGIYIRGWGGIRIEDTVIVKAEGCEVITRADKELIII